MKSKRIKFSILKTIILIAAIASSQLIAYKSLDDFSMAAIAKYKEYATRYEKHNESILKTKDIQEVIDQYKVQFEADVKSSGSQLTPGKNFVQKVTLKNPESRIVIMGDIHGSLHSFLRNLEQLVSLGYIDDESFKIREDFEDLYMVFLGDFINGGSLSVEVVYLLLKLKLANWDRVFMVNGNNEMPAQRGGLDEHKNKFPTEPGKSNVIDQMKALFDEFPLAVYIGHGANYIQCSHAALEDGSISKAFITKDDANNPRIYKSIDGGSGCYGTFLYQDNTGKPGTTTEQVTTLLNKYGLKALFRGHQDSYYGFKKFLGNQYTKIDANTYVAEYEKLLNSYKAKLTPEKLASKQKKLTLIKTMIANSTKPALNKPNMKDRSDRMIFFARTNKKGDLQDYKAILNYGYAAYRPTGSKGNFPAGPYNWTDVVSSEDQKKAKKQGYPIWKYNPILTFTTATEGRNVPFDSFAILQTNPDWKQWLLKPYITNLEPTPEKQDLRHHKYLHIYYKGQPDTPALDDKTTIRKTRLIYSWQNSPMKYKPAITKTPLSPLTQPLTNLKTKLALLAKELRSLGRSKRWTIKFHPEMGGLSIYREKTLLSGQKISEEITETIFKLPETKDFEFEVRPGSQSPINRVLHWQNKKNKQSGIATPEWFESLPSLQKDTLPQ